MTANLCKCNNCGTILIDQNPQIGAKEHPLTGVEQEMQYKGGLAENGETNYYWVCPVCDTDEYLTDL
jgi:hypothetical protein